MPVLSVDRLKKGMVLKRDLEDADGRVLLRAGFVLGAEDLERLKSWGVREVEVEDEPAAELEEFEGLIRGHIDPKVLAWCEGPVASFFALTDLSHPVVRGLYRIARLRTAQALTAGEIMHHLRPDLLEEYAPLVPWEGWESEVPPLAGLLQEEVELSSFPDIYHRILEVLENPMSSAVQLAAVVDKDTSLSAKLLKLVNSAFFGFVSKVDTIHRAIALVGTDELTTLALGLSVVHYFRDIPRELMDMRVFWRHSVSCGVFAKTLAGLKGLEARERFFVAGLLHDLGRLIMFKKLPRAATRAMIRAHTEPMSLAEAEREVIGYDHAAVGGLLLQKWKIPPALSQMVRFHHGPEKAENQVEASIVHLADVMALVHGFGQVSLERVPPPSERAWEILGLGPRDLVRAFVQADDQIQEINMIFLENVA
ncbi:MAG: HDOD domain-containing protein [Thermodesulfobacteriota bacterium]